ncbi:putative multi-domain containing protein [Aduncisulcus paluster]|uniref:Multi-domain containing protein n=1 Tax=Aduncisulcus paluster TaxID=2918883 RepID=A0ABQ5KRN7_9EUKA|nr:putative multi-domain containing protein [Aduncisulcus paluster]
MEERTKGGIPKAVFIENVERWVKQFSGEEEASKTLQDLYSKYTEHEEELKKQRNALTLRIPILEDDLKALLYMKRTKESGKELKTMFELNDGVYAEGIATHLDSAVIMLGAGTLVDFDIDEGIVMMKKHIAKAQGSIDKLDETLEFLKAQRTTTEVNISRLFNYGTHKRREEKAAEEAGI